MDEGILPSRVLIAADTIGGLFRYAMDIARGLSARGVLTILATMGRPVSVAQRRAAAAVDNLILVQSAYRLEWMHGARNDVERSGDWLLDLEARFTPDVVHVNGYNHAALAWRAPVVVSAHYCLRSWWRAVNNAEAPAEWRTHMDDMACGLAAADLVIAPTEAFLAELERNHGPLPHGRVINLGRDPSIPRPKDPKQPLVLTVGRLWDQANNIEALEDVAGQLEWPVVAAGERHPPGEASSGAYARGNLRHLGALPEAELIKWQNRAAIFALPARHKPFGLSVLEAALAECALVLGDVPSLRELWDGAAIFVAPDDRAALHAALSALIHDPVQRRSLGQLAMERARQYGAAAMTSEYCAAYSELIHPNVRGLAAPATARDGENG